jgi:hypothetical protein
LKGRKLGRNVEKVGELGMKVCRRELRDDKYIKSDGMKV